MEFSNLKEGNSQKEGDRQDSKKILKFSFG